MFSRLVVREIEIEAEYIDQRDVKVLVDAEGFFDEDGFEHFTSFMICDPFTTGDITRFIEKFFPKLYEKIEEKTIEMLCEEELYHGNEDERVSS